MGHGKLKVRCADGNMRMTRIPGKMKKRIWIREGDPTFIRNGSRMPMAAACMAHMRALPLKATWPEPMPQPCRAAVTSTVCLIILSPPRFLVA